MIGRAKRLPQADSQRLTYKKGSDRMNRALEVSILGLVLGTTTFLLSGCEAVRHVSMELRHGSIRFANCEDYRATGIQVDAAPAGKSSNEYKPVWEAYGPKPVKKGVPVEYGLAPAGFTSSVGPTAFSPTKSLISVTFTSQDTQAGPGPGAVFDGRKLVEGHWLNWDDRIVDSACSG